MIAIRKVGVFLLILGKPCGRWPLYGILRIDVLEVFGELQLQTWTIEVKSVLLPLCQIKVRLRTYVAQFLLNRSFVGFSLLIQIHFQILVLGRHSVENLDLAGLFSLVLYRTALQFSEGLLRILRNLCTH